MSAIRRRILMDAFRLFDVALMVLSFSLATLAVYRNSPFGFGTFFSMRVKVGNFILFFGLLAAWHVVLKAFGLYDSWRLSSHRAELVNILKATSLGTLAILVFAVVFRIRLITPVFALVFWACVSAAVVLSRVVLRHLLQQVRVRGRNLRALLIVGTNPRAVGFARKIESEPNI